MNLLEITQPLQTIIHKAFFLPTFTKVGQYCTNSIVFNETVKLVKSVHFKKAILTVLSFSLTLF